MKAFLCELILSCTLATPGAKPIDELTYGTILFSYYQQDHEQALLDTLVAEAQDRRGADALRFDLAKGSFAFGAGMYEYSRDVFANVGERAITDLDRMRLAFHLAREYHRRGDYRELARQLERIDGWGQSLVGKRAHPEVEYMRAEQLLVAGDRAAAGEALARLHRDEPLRAYGLFNLGVAQRAAGDLGAARIAFTALDDVASDLADVRDLKQRAKLALAFIAREQNDAATAESVLAALPGSGRYRDVALATYGGMAMDQGDYELAARIWLTLKDQAHWSTSTAQARLGFPASLEQLASQQRALAQYREAARSFEARLARLDTLRAAAQDPRWVHGLLLAFSAPEPDRENLVDLMERWRSELGHTDWLEWLATEDVHQVLVQWRELVDMRTWLDALPERLAAYAEVAGERRRRSSEARATLYDRGLLETRSALRTRLTALEGRVGQARAATPVPDAQWMELLADAGERALLDELAEMRRRASTHMSAAERDRTLARLARLQGVVFWNIADAQSARLRALEKQAAAVRSMLTDVDERVVRLQRAEERFAAGVATDFTRFASRAEQIVARVDEALANREALLAEELRRGMRREMQEVQEYLLVARIAIARATDQLAQVQLETPQ